MDTNQIARIVNFQNSARTLANAIAPQFFALFAPFNGVPCRTSTGSLRAKVEEAYTKAIDLAKRLSGNGVNVKFNMPYRTFYLTIAQERDWEQKDKEKLSIAIFDAGTYYKGINPQMGKVYEFQQLALFNVDEVIANWQDAECKRKEAQEAERKIPNFLT